MYISTIGERIKHLRKNLLRLNQTAFSERIALSQSQLASLELNKYGVTDKNIKLICSEFGVVEKWLRSGEGNIFVTINEKASRAYAKAKKYDDPVLLTFLSYYDGLSDEAKINIQDMIICAAEEIKKRKG